MRLVGSLVEARALPALRQPRRRDEDKRGGAVRAIVDPTTLEIGDCLKAVLAGAAITSYISAAGRVGAL